MHFGALIVSRAQYGYKDGKDNEIVNEISFRWISTIRWILEPMWQG